MTKIPFGPTYDEMLDPGLLGKDVRDKALTALKQNELDPINLFNITWKDASNRVRKVVLPRALTGIDANIVRLVMVLLAVFGGSGVVLYLVAWAIVPVEDAGEVTEP